MGWFDLFGKRPPADFAFFSPRAYAKFLRVVGHHLRQEGLQAVLSDGCVVVAGEEELRFGLHNLARECRQRPESEWSQLVAGHVAAIAKVCQEQFHLQRHLSDFERMAPLLALRLWPIGYAEGTACITRSDLPGVQTVLVFDLPHSYCNVAPEVADTWGLTEHELFELALDNVRLHCVPGRMAIDAGDGVSLQVIAGENFLTATHALLLDEHPDCLGPHGALVGVPTRHGVICHPIHDGRVVPAVLKMIPMLHGMHREGPGSISPKLYWRRADGFVDLPYDTVENVVQFAPPVAFFELILSLMNDAEPF